MTTRQVPLGDILDLRRDQIEVDPLEIYQEIGVRSFGNGLFVKSPITGAELGDKRVFRVQASDLVVSNVFAWEGAVAVAHQEHDRLIGSHRFMTWVPRDEGSVNVIYLKHFLTSNAGLALLRGASPGSAGRNKTLSISNFRAIQVPLPNFSTQSQIADHLDRIAGVESKKRPSYNYFRTLKERILSAIQQEDRHLEKLACILRAKSAAPVATSDSYRIAGVYSFGRGLLDRGIIKGSETRYAEMTPLDENDVVYSKLGAFEGAVAVVDEKFSQSYVSPEFPVFEISPNVHSDYLRHQLTSLSFQESLSASSSGVGARQKRVSPSAFLNLSVVLPSLRTQQRISRILNKVDAAWKTTQEANSLSSALLPAARNEIFSVML